MIGCLCIHGFTGAPFEVEPLANYLRKHTNWKIVVPTLPGHGENASLKGIKYTDWVECAEKELLQLLKECEEVYLIGFSMGGMIACYLTSKYPVKKLVLLSAAAKYINPKRLALDMKDLITDLFYGKVKENEFYLRFKNKIMKTPISATLQFRNLVASYSKALKEVRVPTFIAQGKSDSIVPPKSAEYLYRIIPATYKKLFWVDEAKHLICHCEGKETLFREIYVFLTGEQPAKKDDRKNIFTYA
ncbi:alpha/beta hydrolase [Peribacillus tepidiphilus]|uniref:alpha/beta hydrolase n=1 Tax=Peribacillus tepidiphilus TaxID=2652445 RepID=UPI0035B50ED8